MAKKESRHAELVSASQIIDAPYELPEGWKWVRLVDVCETLTGSTPSKKRPEFYGGSFPFFKPADLDQGMQLFEASEYLSELGKKCSRFIPAHSTLICCIGSIGKSGYSLRDGTSNQQINAAIPRSIINSKFLFYAVNSENFKNQLWENSSSTTISIINKSKMDNCILPLPPLFEQQRIISRIESMFAKLDEAKEKAQNVVDSFETRKAAILHQAFTGNLTAKWRKENGVSDDSWKYVKLEDIVKKEKNALKAGPFGSSLKKEFYVSSGYKIYGQEQVLNSDENYGDYFIDETKYKELESCKVSPNDILISLVGTVGKTLILSENCLPGIINPRLIKISLDSGIMIPQFFTYYFGSDYCKNKYKTVQHGTTMDVLNMGILKSLDYPCCSLNEQHEIVRILDTVLEKERTAKSAAEQVLEQIDLLKKSILARAFRGEL